MNVIEPILERLPPKVAIPALLSVLMLLGGHAVANWHGTSAATRSSIARAEERLDRIETDLAAETASRAQAQIDTARRLESIERKLDRLLNRR